MFRTTWASAASATSQATPVSPHQTLKLNLNRLRSRARCASPTIAASMSISSNVLHGLLPIRLRSELGTQSRCPADPLRCSPKPSRMAVAILGPAGFLSRALRLLQTNAADPRRSSPDPIPQVAGPRFHHVAATLEEIRAEVGPLDTAHDVCERGLRDLSVNRCLRAPVPEAAAETVDRGVDPEPTDQPAQFRTSEPPASGRWEDEPLVAKLVPSAGEHLERPQRQRDPMLLPCLHPRRRDRPGLRP